MQGLNVKKARGLPVHPVQPTSKLLPLLTVPEKALLYPELRYMGSKKRLLPWIHSVLNQLM
jgi:adenine-specific DNA-methyltransferase